MVSMTSPSRRREEGGGLVVARRSVVGVDAGGGREDEVTRPVCECVDGARDLAGLARHVDDDVPLRPVTSS